MNFEEFIVYKQQVLQHQSEIIDLSETQLSKVVAEKFPLQGYFDLPQTSHRCHLAEWWLDYLQLSRQYKPQVLMCKGVRHALSLLFGEWATAQKTVLLPADVYPVYLSLAERANLNYHTYTTLPTIQLKHLDDTDVLLITDPIKPLGCNVLGDVLTDKSLHNHIKETIKNWLLQKPERRLIIDNVYFYGQMSEVSNQWQFIDWLGESTALNHQQVCSQLASQVIILQSMSKAWAKPLVLGVCIVPKQDIHVYTPLFRANSPNMAELQLAEVLLTQYVHYPKQLGHQLNLSRIQLIEQLQSKHVPIVRQDHYAFGCYHLLIDLNWQNLLNDFDILGLPASVFGSSEKNLTIVTSLNLLCHQT